MIIHHKENKSIRYSNIVFSGKLKQFNKDGCKKFETYI